MTTASRKQGPLAGIRVLEAGLFAAGPACGAVLADWGAEVIKIEPPQGERARRPGAVKSSGAAVRPANPRHDLHNRGKSGLALDLKTDAGRALLARIVPTVDVFVTNIRSAALRRLGADYETLSAISPALVYGHITGYGRDSDRPSYDHGAFWSESGAALLFAVDGEEPPQPTGGMGDRVAGSILAGGIAAALFERVGTGTGRLVTVPLFGTGLWMTGSDASDALQLGAVQHGPRREGAPTPLLNCYQAGDGRWVWLTIMDPERFWDQVREVTGCTAMADERFAGGEAASIKKHAGALREALDDAFRTRTAQEWGELLERADIPFGVVRTVGEALGSSLAKQADVFLPVTTPAGDYQVINTPCHFLGQERGPVRPSPDVGSDTDDVLRSAGCSDDEIDELRRSGVVV